MNMKFFSSCYTIASLSTCVLNDKNNEDWFYGDSTQVQITDKLSAVVSYHFICSDHMSLYDHEVHKFHIEFLRDGKLLDGFSFERKYNEKKFGSLTNPDLHVELKLATINDLKPGLVDKIRALAMSSLLTPEEMKAVITKSDELANIALSLKQNQNSK